MSHKWDPNNLAVLELVRSKQKTSREIAEMYNTTVASVRRALYNKLTKFDDTIQGPRTITLEEVRSSLGLEAYTLLEQEYKNAHTKMRTLCPKNHEYFVNWNNWSQNGTRCLQCLREDQQITIAELQINFRKKGCTLLETKFINSYTKMKYLCVCGEVKEISWNHFMYRKAPCKQCGERSRKLLEIERRKEAFEEAKYTLCQDTFVDALTKMPYICSQGHHLEMTWSSWQQGVRCSTCATNQKKIPIEHIQKVFTVEKYILHSSSYENAHQQMLYTCPKGHNHHTTWNNWQQGYRCPFCSDSSSQPEKDLLQIYQNLNPIKTRAIITPSELDIYFPKHKLAIEYCGLFWHSSFHERMIPRYHFNKLEQCINKGIRLITIFEDEWLNDKQLCLSRINAALGINQNKLQARKCVLKEVPQEVARDFLNKNHLQGSSGREIAYGLFYKEELVSVMTLGKPARAHVSKNIKVLELKRFASLPNTIVVGGASRLFKKAIEYARSKEYEEIRSYCDMRWGTGNVYQKLGFILRGTSKYTPHYTDFVQRWRNQSFAGNDEQTEEERAEEKKVYKIYDCGHQTWSYSLLSVSPVQSACTQ